MGILAATAGSTAPAGENVIRVQLIDNSGFTDALRPATPERLPWWTTEGVAGGWRSRENGISLERGSVLVQPLAVPPELAEHVSIQFFHEGGVLTVRDATGRSVRIPPGDGRLSIVLGEFPDWAAGPLTPRLSFELSVAEGNEQAKIDVVKAWVTLPCPTDDELRTELVTELEWILGNWFERGLDRVGPRETAFLSTVFDCQTGANLMHLEGGAHPFYALLARALQVHENAEWSVQYEAYLKDLFELGFHPDTGLPRVWNVERDVADDETPREVAYAFGHLLDIVEDGPKAWRARALAQAVRIGDLVLERGVLPDGEVAARYRPRDGEPNTSYPPLRRLDVPCELARLGALTGDDRYTAAARDAFAQFEFTHSWPGTWDAIDPGFDDNYGHYGARAVKAWKAHPDEPAFRNIAEGGARHYMPIWRDALQLGGNIAADQVRCWKILRDVAALEPSLKPEVGELLHLASRNHFKGQQYADGTWGDVTIFGFDPKAHLEVGDLPGIARNLIEGLAFVYQSDQGHSSSEQRGLFTAVFRSSRDHYKREYGYLSTRTERAGANPAGGGVRLAAGMVEMLHQLSEPPR